MLHLLKDVNCPFFKKKKNLWCANYGCSPCRSLTRSTTPHGIALLGGTLAATWRTRQSISSTSTWAKWPFYSSSQAEISNIPKLLLIQPIILGATLYICYHLFLDMASSWFPVRFSLILFAPTLQLPLAMCVHREADAQWLPIMLALSQHLHIWQTHHDS